MNVGHATDAALERVPDRIALVVDGNEYTYRQLESRIRQACSALAGLGVGPGDRVALVNLGSALSVATIFGARRNFSLAPTKRMTFIIDTDRTVIEVIKSEVRMGVHGDKSLQVLKDRQAV